MAAQADKKTKNDFWLTAVDFAKFIKKQPAALMKDLKKAGIEVRSGIISPSDVRRFLTSRGFEYKKQVVSFQMLKGGVAKTTSALNFGLRAHMYGARVLFVDLDQQGNLSFALGVQDESLPVWLDIVEKKSSIKDCTVKLDLGLDLIPSHLNNSVLDRVLVTNQRNWAQAIKGPLSEVESNYDLIIIDTAPALSTLNTAITCASDLVVLPINPDRFSWLGLQRHLEDLADVREDFDLNFEEKILFTKFDAREKTSHELLQKSLETFTEQLLKSYIRTNTEVKNSIGSGKFIFSNQGPAKEDYDLVTLELMGWEA
jgi:chromosome partitioning protein